MLNSRRILIVDDDAHIRELMSRLVALLGYEAEVAADGHLGAKAFESADGEFACVLLDAVMPGMGGPDALRRMRMVRPETPVLCVSGLPQDEIRSLFGECQPDGYLGKPCDGAQLVASIERVAALAVAPA